MKKVIEFFKSDFGIAILLISTCAIILIIGFCCGNGEWAMAIALPASVQAGGYLSGEPLTTDIVKAQSPDLLPNEIDTAITQIRPMSTPVDQITRLLKKQKSGSMIVDYYSVDYRESTSNLTSAYTEPSTANASEASKIAKIDTKGNHLFEVSETILAVGQKGYLPDSATLAPQDLILYVTSKDADGKLNVMAVNGKKIGTINNCVPSISVTTKLVRMGRAATELDVQTAQFETIPVKSQNYCQIFKMQIEQSTFLRIANKEANWDFSDAEEAAIYDMRLGMEKTFLFGTRLKMFNSLKKEDVYFTEGIWWQAANSFEYKSTDIFDQKILVDITRKAFTGNAGSKRKILIGGSELIGSISKIETDRVVRNSSETVKWGLDFSEISTKFGKLYVIFSEIFDECGMASEGLVLDPAYITKWTHVPFAKQELDLKKAGIRNTDAIVLTEASCLTLRYPAAHMRITRKTV